MIKPWRCNALIALLCFLITAKLAFATAYPLPPPHQRLIGEPTKHTVVRGDYFQRLAEQFNVGFLALIAANPGVDPFLTYQKPSDTLVSAQQSAEHAVSQSEKKAQSQASIHIPTQLLLPFVERRGIVINLPELRLYYFQPELNRVHVFPVGIGRKGLATPNLTSYIGEKRKDPIWRPTQEMKARYLAEKGIILADEIPSGPNNPFGKYALRLATSEFLIHGTNQRFGIGTRASSGCIRMYDDDIKWLFENVPLNTQVKIIDQPIKMSYEKPGVKLFEVHQALTSEQTAQQNADGWQRLVKFIGESEIERYRADFEKPSGLVIRVEKAKSAAQQAAD
ncbi:L,D-transpeptidase family protein [Thalassotalea euphylliae]|uniref:Peptidoglycan-binding protein n=1 Tax=Thalassotalea euphylliae TaxID=1655234 RepID=A0A3E0U7C0_9GAMM|nr:L,D-transpeptidase family protein [Thalassotalea euphylliae]REL32035.1 peptidoglycan-binding protein [Thalassotalea euphylliae]